MSSGKVESSTDGRGVATVTLDNQKKLNIIGADTVAALTGAISALAKKPGIRCIVLTGAGERAFIGGADVGEMGNLAPESARTFITNLHLLCREIRTAPVPVIAKIRGYCLGGGLEIAAACDLRIASDDGVFGMPEVRMGIPSVIEAALLPQLIGWGKTKELVLTGNVIDAAEALRTGLVERVVSGRSLDAATETWIEGILESGPVSLKLQKELVLEWERLPMEDAITRGIDYFAKAFETPEPTDRMRAFIARKKK